MREDTGQRHVIVERGHPNTGGVTHRHTPVVGGLTRHRQKPDGDGAHETTRHGGNTAPVFAHQQDKPERERGELNTASDTDQHPAGDARGRTQEVSQHQQQDDRVNLPKVGG